MSPKKKRKLSKGTGQRYTTKEPKPRSAPVRRTPPPASYAEQALRKRISRFGLSQRFQHDFEQALEQYLGPGVIQMHGDQKVLALDEREGEFAGFQEWFYFDYVLGSGDRIIDLFAEEVGPGLSAPQRDILADWLATNRLRLLETQSVEPGIGETMQDLLTGEILYMNDISFSHHGIRWSIFLARPILTEERWQFTGGGAILTPLEKPQIMKVAGELWDAYREKHAHADLMNFYRDHSLDLYLAQKEILEERAKPKALFTKEGHSVLPSRAKFAIKGNPRAAENALDEAEEYVFVGEQEKGEFSGCLHYLWLLRGRSAVPGALEDQALSGGHKLTSLWTAGPGEPDYRTLGDLYLCWEEVTLSCISRERLQAGKDLLKQVLGRRIKHRQDHYQDLSASPHETEFEDEQASEDEWEKTAELGPEARLVEEQLVERLTRSWLDTPDDEGVTPRQAARTPEGKEKLRETLKMIEFLADQALKSGKRPPMRLDIIREELEL